MEEYKVYIKINELGYIISINSSEFLESTSEWIEIDSGSGDKYHHAQNNYFSCPIVTDDGAYRYKMVDGKPVECSLAEIIEQEAANKIPSAPSQLDIIEAQVTYTAMMTDTLLEV